MFFCFLRQIRALIIVQKVLATLLVGVVVWLVMPVPTFAASAAERLKEAVRPRQANYYLSWELREQDLPELARWDVVILDMEHQVTHPEYLKKLREINPSIVLLAYITSQEISDGTIADFKARTPLRYELLQGVRPEWYLTSVRGTKFSFWEHTYMLNITPACPAPFGSTWSSYLAHFVAQRIAASGLWDGVLYDNVWQNIDWFTAPRGGVDLDHNAEKDGATALDTAWQKGYTSLFAETRKLAPAGFLVFGNVGLGHAVYGPSLDGALFEQFPGFDWTYAMREARKQIATGRNPFLILNGVSKTGVQSDWRSVRFGVTSALLIDAYFSFDHGDLHTERWWYDEYNVDVGIPLGAAYSVSGSKDFVADSVWRRDFSRAIVLVNPSPGTRKVKFKEPVLKIDGRQDRSVNNGVEITEITIPPHDGIILLKKTTPVAQSVFINGAIARTANVTGVLGEAHTLFVDNAPSGVPVFIGDIVGNKESEGIIAGQSKIEIWGNNQRIFSDYPFGTEYVGGMNLAVGKRVSDGSTVFAVAARRGGAVVIYTSTGTKIATIYPLGIAYRGGLHAAFANVWGDGQEELMVATGEGVASEVLVYDQTYRTIVERFSPYEKRDTQGISLAVFSPKSADDPVFVTISQGAKPLVRIFTATQKKLKEFFVKPVIAGSKLEVQTSDGKLRIEEFTK